MSTDFDDHDFDEGYAPYEDEWVTDIRDLGHAPSWDDLHRISADTVDGTAGDVGNRDYWHALCERAGTVAPDGEPTELDIDEYMNRYVYPGIPALRERLHRSVLDS